MPFICIFFTLAHWLWPVRPVFELWDKNEGLYKQLSSKEPKLFHLFPLHSQEKKGDKCTVFYGSKKMKERGSFPTCCAKTFWNKTLLCCSKAVTFSEVLDMIIYNVYETMWHTHLVNCLYDKHFFDFFFSSNMFLGTSFSELKSFWDLLYSLNRCLFPLLPLYTISFGECSCLPGYTLVFFKK